MGQQKYAPAHFAITTEGETYGRLDKTEYSANDVARWARLFDIPWKPGYPENYPLTRTQDVLDYVSSSVIGSLTDDDVASTSHERVYPALSRKSWGFIRCCNAFLLVREEGHAVVRELRTYFQIYSW